MFNSSMPSLSDIAAVTRNGDNDGFGGNNGWWILIILFALFGGWGRGGYYDGSGMDSGAGSTNAILATDSAALERKMDGINNGLCDGFYSMNTGMLNGFSGVNSNIMQLGYNVQFGQANLGQQIQNCCCKQEQLLADLKYQMATDSCAITNAVNQAAQQIMQNDNANYRQLHDENVQARMEAKDETIAALRQQLSQRDTQATVDAQSAYLCATLGQKQPIPAYVVDNPYCNCGSSRNNCCGNSCC